MKRKIAASLSVVILLVCLLGIQEGFLDRWQTIRNDQETHTDIKEELLRLERLVAEVDNGFRGYVLMKDSIFLEPMVAAEGKIPGLLDHLATLTAPWPDLQSRAQVLAYRVNELLEVKRRLTRDLVQGHEEDVLTYIREGQELALANSIALAFQDLEGWVDQRERTQTRDRDQVRTWTRVVLVASTLGTFGLGVGMGRMARFSSQATFAHSASAYPK